MNKIDVSARMCETLVAEVRVDDFAVLQSARLLVFEALLQQATGNQDAAKRAWATAAGTAREEMDDEGLFRAIAFLRAGNKEKAEMWLKNFTIANERNLASDRAATRSLANYLSGIYAALHGRPEQARDSFRKCLAIDRSHLWGRQALAWLEADLLKP